MRDRIEKLRRAWERGGHGYHTLVAETAAEQDALTKVRKAGLGLLMAASRARSGRPPSSRTRRWRPSGSTTTSRASSEMLDRHGLEAGFYGHCSVGCLHIRPFVDLSTPARRGDDGGGGVGDRRPGGRVRRRQLQRARRRARAQRLQPARVRRGPVRRVPQGEGAVRPRRALQPGRDGRRRADHGEHPRRCAAAREAAAPRRCLRRSAGCAGRPTAASASAPAARRAAA